MPERQNANRLTTENDAVRDSFTATLIHSCCSKKQQPALGQISISRVGQYSISADTVTSKSENMNTVEIHAVEGRLYYIWQEVRMRFLYARTKLNLVSDEDGKKGVLETQLVETKQHKVKRCFAHQPPHK
jgi:hypothetical protein